MTRQPSRPTRLLPFDVGCRSLIPVPRQRSAPALWIQMERASPPPEGLRRGDTCRLEIDAPCVPGAGGWEAVCRPTKWGCGGLSGPRVYKVVGPVCVQ